MSTKHQIQPEREPVTSDGLRRLQLALEAQIVAAGASGVYSFNTRTGVVSLVAGDVTTALGLTFVGNAGKVLAVNGTETALELVAGGGGGSGDIDGGSAAVGGGPLEIDGGSA